MQRILISRLWYGNRTLGHIMNQAIKRKLHQHIEFAAGNQHGRFDAQDLSKEVLGMLDYLFQTAIVNSVISDAINAWMKTRIARTDPEQLPLPDFPPMIKVGRRAAVEITKATAKELEPYYQKLKARVSDMQQHLGERLQASQDSVREQFLEDFAQAKAELAEMAKVRKLIRQAARSYPEITVEEVLQRQAEKTGKSAGDKWNT